MQFVTDPYAPTPLQRVGDYWVKRDDLFECNGARGAKCRSALGLLANAKGCVSFGSRTSPQGACAAAVAQHYDIPSIFVTAHGKPTPEAEWAESRGSEIKRISPGYMSQCKSDATKEAKAIGYELLPLGMESELAMKAASWQVELTKPPADVKRIVIPVGCGCNAGGVMHGLRSIGSDIPVVGVQIGKDAKKALKQWAPIGWQNSCRIVESGVPYATAVDGSWNGLELDPYYEAKCVQFLEPGDLFWLVGVRPSI